MHVIQDMEGFLKEIESAVYVWFGDGVDGENGKNAINEVIASHASEAPKKKVK